MTPIHPTHNHAAFRLEQAPARCLHRICLLLFFLCLCSIATAQSKAGSKHGQGGDIAFILEASVGGLVPYYDFDGQKRVPLGFTFDAGLGAYMRRQHLIPYLRLSFFSVKTDDSSLPWVVSKDNILLETENDDIFYVNAGLSGFLILGKRGARASLGADIGYCNMTRSKYSQVYYENNIKNVAIQTNKASNGLGYSVSAALSRERVLFAIKDQKTQSTYKVYAVFGIVARFFSANLDASYFFQSHQGQTLISENSKSFSLNPNILSFSLTSKIVF